MSSIDERVVAMKFNNGQFQKGVADTAKSLQDLKKGLDLKGAGAGLENLNETARRFSLEGIQQGLQDIGSKFTTLGIVGVTALTNIANKAVDTGIQLAKSLAIDPIMEGFGEYELKMGSIQTILANTARHGTTLEDVSNTLNDLNEYADKTIYNFADMTKNIGLFTNAGIKVEDATSMIKGFSNVAATSGTSAQGASHAAYQLSQALSTGTIRAMDWISLTNVGMGNKNMQDSLYDIAVAMGAVTEGTDLATQIQSDFKGSLAENWLSADVMSSYLQIMAGDMDAAGMAALGLSDAQITAFQESQKTAEDAATKVRTMTQLWGTLKEAVGSSWAQTFEILFGDFEEATDLFTGIYEAIDPIISGSGDALNSLLQGWADLGGRTALINALGYAFENLMAFMEPIGEAFKEIFPPVTAQQLFTITEGIRDLMIAIRPSEKTLDNLKRTFKGVFAVLDIGWGIVKGVASIFGQLFAGLGIGAVSLLDVTAAVGDFLVGLRDAIVSGGGLKSVFDFIADALKNLLGIFGGGIGTAGSFIDEVAGGLTALVEAFKAGGSDVTSSGIAGMLERVGLAARWVYDAIDEVRGGFVAMGAAFQAGGSDITSSGIAGFMEGIGLAARWLTDQMGALWDLIAPILSSIGTAFKNAFSDGNFDGLTSLVNSGIIVTLGLALKNFIDGLGEFTSGGGGLISGIKDVFGALTEQMSAMTANIQSKTLMNIALAIGILTLSVIGLSMVDPGKLTSALTAMAVMFAQMFTVVGIFDKFMSGGSFAKLPIVAGSLILLAFAMGILAGAVVKLSGLSWSELAVGLTGVVALLGALVGVTQLMKTNLTGMISAGLGMIAIAIAVNVLVSAVEKFAALSWAEISKGLVGVATTLGALALFTQMAKVSKGSIASALGIVLLGSAIKIMASAVGDFAQIKASSLLKGLMALVAVMGAIAGFTKVMGSPERMISMGLGLVLLGAAMNILVTAVARMAEMSPAALVQGLLGMAGALGIIALAMSVMPANMLATAAALVVVGLALNLIGSSIKSFGSMSWEEIGKGLVTLAGSLLIIAGAMYLMTGALPGAAALIVVALALSMLAPVLMAFGAMSVGEIATALGMLAGVFLVIGLAGLALTPVVPTLMALAGALALLGLAAVLAGAGVLMIGLGLTMLAGAGAAAGAALVSIVQGLVGLIPYVLEQIGHGIVALAGVITEGAPAIMAAFVAILTALVGAIVEIIPLVVDGIVTLLMAVLEAIIELTPVIIEALVVMIKALVDAIVELIPYLVDAGMEMIAGILRGIADNIGDVVTEALRIVENFIRGITDGIPGIIDAGADMIITFIESLATTIRNNTDRMNSAARELADAIINGMTGGLWDKAGEVWQAAKDVASQALQGAKDFLGIKSPSREFRKIGRWSSEGMAEGLESGGGMVHQASEVVAKDALETMRSALSGLADTIDSDMDMSPTIRPVLDLSNYKKDSKLMDSMMPSSYISPYASYGTASALSTERAIATSESMGESETTTPGASTIINYTQNNTSPKALSEAEIYRQTKNQISTVKGVLDAQTR